MSPEERAEIIRQNCYPQQHIYAPRTRDSFSVTQSSDSHEPALQAQQNYSPSVEPVVQKILRENKNIIEKEALRLTAPLAVNIREPIYHDLISLSVDEAAVVEEAEKRINGQRAKANAVVLGHRQ